MATEVATEIAGLVAKPLLVRVKRELKFWASSGDYVKEMQTKVSVLAGAVTDMGNQQRSCKIERRMPPARVPDWLKEANEIKERAGGVSTHGVGCSNIKTRYKAGKESAVIVKDIDRLITEMEKMTWRDDITPLAIVSPPRPSTSVAVHEVKQNQNNLKSRDSIFNDALKFLEADNNKTQKMALCGMGGIGKTTMMEQLEKVVRGKYIFPVIVKVEVGRNKNQVDVQRSVAEKIGAVLVETDIDTRAEILRKRFKVISEEGKKKVLVILDNVWEVINLNHIGLTSPLPNGFKLLLTSREETVCRQMGVEASSMFRMTPLDKPECKKLFWETTGLGSVSNIQADLYKIGEEIIKRCGGLPLAITAIASALGDNKEKDEWADALSRLNNTSVDDYNIREVFKISYENLKEDDLKAIFLLGGLFPEANNISREDLLWYGWGLKFFQNVGSIAEARKRVNTCVNKLIRSNLLIKSDGEGSVKIHDLVRDFVLSNFTEVKQGSNISGKFKQEESYERVLLKCGDTFELPVDFHHPNLKLLMLMGNIYTKLKLPEDYLARMQKLEVAAYANVHELLLPRHSTNLRTLSIHFCSLVDKDISFVGDLINLEVLSLVRCDIDKLPSGIEKLKRLKLLDLTGNSDHFCIDVFVLQSLDRLEELYLGKSTFTNGNFEKLKMFSSKLSALEVDLYWNKGQAKYMSYGKLERFIITIGRRTKPEVYNTGVGHYYIDADFDAYVGNYPRYSIDPEYASYQIIHDVCKADYNNYSTNICSFKNTLLVVASKSELLECKINELFSKTEILCLEVKDMNHLEDFSTHPPQNTFCNLKNLDVDYCTDLAYLFTMSVAKGLTELETLKIRRCPVLKSLINGEYCEVEGVIKFQKLKILCLVDLPELVSLCDPINIVMELPQLVELHLCELNSFTRIFHENNIKTSAKQSFLNTELVMPKLEKVKVHHMQNLEEIWPCEITSRRKLYFDLERDRTKRLW